MGGRSSHNPLGRHCAGVSRGKGALAMLHHYLQVIRSRWKWLLLTAVYWIGSSVFFYYKDRGFREQDQQLRYQIRTVQAFSKFNRGELDRLSRDLHMRELNSEQTASPEYVHLLAIKTQEQAETIGALQRKLAQLETVMQRQAGQPASAGADAAAGVERGPPRVLPKLVLPTPSSTASNSKTSGRSSSSSSSRSQQQEDADASRNTPVPATLAALRQCPPPKAAALLRDRDGTVFRVCLNPTGFRHSDRLRRGTRSSHAAVGCTSPFSWSALPAGQLVVDVGAGLGACTLSYAAHGHKVVAFDAVWSNVRNIRESAALDGSVGTRVHAVYRALGGGPAQGVVVYDPSDERSGLVVPMAPALVEPVRGTLQSLGRELRNISIGQLDTEVDAALAQAGWQRAGEAPAEIGLLNLQAPSNLYGVLGGAQRLFAARRIRTVRVLFDPAILGLGKALHPELPGEAVLDSESDHDALAYNEGVRLLALLHTYKLVVAYRDPQAVQAPAGADTGPWRTLCPPDFHSFVKEHVAARQASVLVCVRSDDTDTQRRVFDSVPLRC